MDRETFMNMTDDERIEYMNGRLGADEKFEDILAELGIEKKEFGEPQPYGLGLIKVGKEVRLKPGRGDNSFAW